MYVSKAETPEQECVLQKLEELFFTTPRWQLRQLCIANNWDLELCVNQWMSFINNGANNEGANPATKPILRSNSSPKKENTFLSDRDRRIGDHIKNGYRVMILMRGPPGVGKTYSAREIVKNFVDLQPPFCNIGDFIFSTDDYFYNSRGVYRYNVKYLSEAHEFNQNRVREKAISGFSPIIVDNTNLKLWEMMPYVKYAVQHGYLIEIVEPKPVWNKCASKLAQRNIHGVAADKIRIMMDKYERGDVTDLMKMLKNTKYTVSLPQMRLIPPFKPKEPEKMEIENEANVEVTGDTSNWGSYDTNAPKGQRKKFKTGLSPPKVSQNQKENSQPAEEQISKESNSSYSPSPIKSASERDVYSLLEKKLSNVWKPYEAESVDFWGLDQHNTKSFPTFDKDKKTRSAEDGEKSLIDLLRDKSDKRQIIDAKEENEEKESELEMSSPNSFNRHSVGCPNENVAFVTLRQIYPNKEVSGLWDLFAKCNGDIDWAIDILLKEDELARLRGDAHPDENFNGVDTFMCLCNQATVAQPMDDNKIENDIINQSMQYAKSSNHEDSNEMSQTHRPQRSRFGRRHQNVDPTILEVKENIESRFVLGDDHYSEHLLKIRNIRSGLATGSVDTTIPMTINCEENGENQRDIVNVEEDDDDDDENGDHCDVSTDDMLEMSLGEHLVQQLLEKFRNESELEERIPPSLPLNLKVFMPRSLAKQLYMLWMESAYNHMEEERQKMVREDEEFARLLKHPKYAEYKQSPSNLREMLNIECAWNLYKRDKEEIDQQRREMEKLSQPTDLAAHLTQMKLCETFPDIPRETLLDILTTTDNNYNETMSILTSTMAATNSQDNDELQQENSNEMPDSSQVDTNNSWNDNDNNSGGSTWSPENAKRLALKEFEEARNLAAHHCQLRAECFQKAKEAIQSGNGGAGIYYSQIANLHKQKIDMYNHRAANCIMNVHKYTQNNPDHLDLHYLHLVEAMGCLDLFLDRHITSLRAASRNYKYIFIITGRGKHSAGGISVIKSKVKARLEERYLKWNEVNPGLLKVKVFSSSRHSQNF
ncbi:uncharacterized protein LOC142233029 [Haematobia irritans]|uniref:uncharacterized protein LOC142233029 n=1 Tax=Haematobia irritans TaxID=7368 RepID=UPI003F4F52A9